MSAWWHGLGRHRRTQVMLSCVLVVAYMVGVWWPWIHMPVALLWVWSE